MRLKDLRERLKALEDENAALKASLSKARTELCNECLNANERAVEYWDRVAKAASSPRAEP